MSAAESQDTEPVSHADYRRSVDRQGRNLLHAREGTSEEEFSRDRQLEHQETSPHKRQRQNTDSARHPDAKSAESSKEKADRQEIDRNRQQLSRSINSPGPTTERRMSDGVRERVQQTI